MLDVFSISAPATLGIVLAAALIVGPFALYRMTRDWSDTSRAAVMLWLVAAGSVLGVVLRPRNFTLTDDGTSSAPAYFFQNETYATWALRADSAVLVGFALAALLTYWFSKDRVERKDPVGVLAVVLYLYYFLTILSGATVAGVPSFDQKSLYIPIVLGALISLRHIDLNVLAHHLKLMLAGTLILSIVAAIVFPEFALLRPYAGQLPGIDFRLFGVAAHANALGPIALLLLLLEFHSPSRSLVRWPLVILALANFALAQSKTVWLAALIVVAVVYVPYRFMALRAKADSHASTIKLVLVLIVCLMAAVITVTNLDMNQRLSGGVMTLTGRTDIWADTLAEFERYPLFGYGPRLWGQEYRIQMGKVYAGQAHNQFIQTLGESGLVGFILLLGYMGVLLRLALRTFSVSQGLSLTLFVLILIRCVTEAPLRGVVNDWTFFMHAVLLVVLATYARHTQSRDARRSLKSHREARLGRVKVQ